MKTREQLQTQLSDLQEQLMYTLSDDEAFDINRRCAETRRHLRDVITRDQYRRKKVRDMSGGELAAMPRMGRADTRYCLEGK